MVDFFSLFHHLPCLKLKIKVSYVDMEICKYFSCDLMEQIPGTSVNLMLYAFALVYVFLWRVTLIVCLTFHPFVDLFHLRDAYLPFD